MNLRKEFEKETNNLNCKVLFGSLSNLLKNAIIRSMIKELHIEALKENKDLDIKLAYKEIGEINQ